jgi:TrmH family RNA methyltransferase
VEVFATAAAAEEHATLLDDLTVHVVDDRAAASLSGAVTPQGIVAVCRFVDRPLEAALHGDTVVLCADVRDPGNAGTVIRGADAAGADAVLVSDASVDVYNPKVVRSTAGSLFHLPVVTGVPIPTLLHDVRAAGLRLLAADGSGTDLLHDVDLTSPHAWVMGNEAWGLEPEVREACDQVVRVPIYGSAESLNLAMAATVCLYTSATVQRRGAQSG